MQLGADFDGRTVFVTGGAQGIGRGIAEHLLARGANVAIGDVALDAASGFVEAWRGSGRLFALKLDVTREASVRDAIARTVARFGALDGLVNNAGIAKPENAPIEKLALADWNRLIATDLTGPFLCAKHAAKALEKRGGAIVNISSTRARQSEPDTEAYAAAKGGLEALTHALAISLGPAVRVNAVAPGWIDTSAYAKRAAKLTRRDHAQHPAGRVGVPEDIAALVALLLSPAAGFVTGSVFVADGGMSRRMIYD